MMKDIEVPGLIRPRLRTLLHAREQIDREIAALLTGVLAVHGISGDEMAELDDETMTIKLRDESVRQDH